ncbi:hypothetical protein QUB40_28855 [Microcoleus sp. AT9_A2]|uniref:hypothetical protein n=1 Tax=Microcoleus sp. AT9_A2 TaxID=2818624 RepID=UPI002FD2DC06
MTPFNWFAKDASQGEQKLTSGDVQRIVGEFNKCLPRIMGTPEVLEGITFEEAISYFQSDRPGTPNLKKGAIIRQEHPEGQILGQVFLDEKNNLVCHSNGIPYGRQLIAKKLDQKLTDVLGAQELVTIELKAKEFGESQLTEEPTQKSRIVKVSKIVSIIIWSIIILIVFIPLLGRLVMSQALAAELTSHPSLEVTQCLVAFGGREEAFKKAVNSANQSAKQYANNELNRWEADLINRIDTDFLNWYFNYFNQKQQEFGVLFQYIGENVMNGFNPTIVNEKIAKSINDNIQREFSRRVLQANSAEMKFHTIVIDTANFYIEQLSKEFDDVPKMYTIPQSDWAKYLEGINFRLQNERGDEVSLVRFVGAAGTAKITATIAAKAGSKAVAALSAKLGSMIEPTLAIGLIAWDYWDYTQGVKEDKPRLREDLVNSLHDIKKSILSEPEHSVMWVVNELEEQIKNNIWQAKFPA